MSKSFAIPAALLAGLVLAHCPTGAQAQSGGFGVVVLGARGGIEDGNLSAFFIHPLGQPDGVTCDAGSLVRGLAVAEAAGAFADVEVPAGSGLSRAGAVLTRHVKAYLLSHAHLDHVAGLLIAAPDDSRKPIMALPSVNAVLEQSYFNWKAWPNFSDRGAAPRLGTYHLQDLVPREKTPVPGTALSVTAYPLRHAEAESTAFLLEGSRDALLCLGDTGPDAVQGVTLMQDVWQVAAERLRAGRLKGIIIESSYPSDRPDNQLFGHLTPKWVLAAMRNLGTLAGRDALKGLPVIISHTKYALTVAQPKDRIRAEFEAGNDLGVRFIVAEQGQRLDLR